MSIFCDQVAIRMYSKCVTPEKPVSHWYVSDKGEGKEKKNGMVVIGGPSWRNTWKLVPKWLPGPQFDPLSVSGWRRSVFKTQRSSAGKPRGFSCFYSPPDELNDQHPSCSWRREISFEEFRAHTDVHELTRKDARRADTSTSPSSAVEKKRQRERNRERAHETQTSNSPMWKAEV
ncbi:hypothetical protein NQZ68_004004 [Dissostichus eleginoides]|nr:hypothetical protein NQZ68_004004 [Dissostichus eleginoides]